MCGGVKFSISNIIWEKGKEHLEDFIKVISGRGLAGVELALSCFWEEPTITSKSEIIWLKNLLTKYTLKVSALHSITYTREDLELFGSEIKRTELLNYIKKYIEICHELETNSIVFGSPKARKTHNNSKEKCDEIFLEFLFEIDKFANDVYFNVEPLHISSCEYLNLFTETVTLIQRGNFKNIKIQLDVRSIIENSESPSLVNDYFDMISHCQVSDPGLKPLAENYAMIHREVGLWLKKNDYQGYITGEILNSDKEKPENFLNKAIDGLINSYAY